MLNNYMEMFNENYVVNFTKLCDLIEKWVKKVPHSEFFDFTSALNEYFDNDKTYSTTYAKRVFLEKIREAGDCNDLHDLFSKFELHTGALCCLLCSETALNNRPLFFPLLMTLQNDCNFPDEDFEKLCFVYDLPENVKAKDLLCETGDGSWESLPRENIVPEKLLSDVEYNITGHRMVVYDPEIG